MRSALFVFFIAGLVISAIGYGTWAVYEDTEVSADNSITLGTLDLVLTDGIPNADGQWMLPNALPNGVIDEEGDVRIYNNGSIEADHVEIAFEISCYEDNDGNISNGIVAGPESDTNQTGIGNWLKEIVVLSMTYSETPSNSNPTLHLVSYDLSGYSYDSNYLTDKDGDGYITLYDLSQQVITGLYAPPALDGDAPDGNYYTTFQMSLQVMEKNGPQNYWQGDVCELIVHVALAQDSNQQILSPGGVVVHLPGGS